MNMWVVSSADSEATSNGSRLPVVRSIIMTSTANTMAANGVLSNGFLETTLGKDGVDYSLIAPTKALKPNAYSFGILQKE